MKLWIAIAFAAPVIALAQADLIRDLDVMVPARDGVMLATDIYRPASGERLPVLLHRTPYDKSARATVAIAEFFARHGYVSMIQDTRGRHKSQGVFSKYYKYDAYDGYDAIEWAGKLPYGNGKVGMWGTSYAAHTQADASKLNPPSLKAMVLNMGGMSNAWNHSVRFDGAFEMGRQLTWAWDQILQDTKDPAVRELLTKEKAVDWYSALPIRKGLSPLAIAPNFEGYYLEEATRADYDDHWQSIGMNWDHYYKQTADVPMLHVGGWFDIYLRGTIENFERLSELKKSEIRLMIGPWTHHGNTRPFAGDVDFGPDAAITDFDTDFHLRWFDHYLKGMPNGTEKQSRIRIFVMGTGDGHKDKDGRMFHGGEWRDAPQWPLPESHQTAYYFHPDGTLSTTPPKAEDRGSTTYTFDPAHPVPTIGGGVSARLRDGAFDQRERPDFPGSRAPYLPLGSRSDVLVFQTEPLAQDVEVIGPVQVDLYAASSGVDTDFTAKLLDVYPPSSGFVRGFDMNLTDAIIRGRYRGGALKQELMTPGTVYPLTIRPFDTANHFKKGHRIRVDISSSNFPRFDVNPNTGEPLGANRRILAVENTVYHSAKYPSRIMLPIVPAKTK
ncbi:MAG TPA: CocE/NonD family hydrolase [Bryobacteraceae bacterium]|nr:CocE/NonD family hydrolase [Bryobacteraceae bacterium]